MTLSVTLELPEELARRAQAVAAKTSRRVEDVLLEWIHRAGEEPPVESLLDHQLLALCDSQMEPGQQAELSDLLERNREGLLQSMDRQRLDNLMRIYRRGLVRKAEALKTAVERGLRPRLS